MFALRKAKPAADVETPTNPIDAIDSAIAAMNAAEIEDVREQVPHRRDLADAETELRTSTSDIRRRALRAKVRDLQAKLDAIERRRDERAREMEVAEDARLEAHAERTRAIAGRLVGEVRAASAQMDCALEQLVAAFENSRRVDRQIELELLDHNSLHTRAVVPVAARSVLRGDMIGTMFASGSIDIDREWLDRWRADVRATFGQ